MEHSRNLNNTAWDHLRIIEEDLYEIWRGDFGPDYKLPISLRIRHWFWFNVWRFARER